jgi:hypothetical protein
LPKWVLWLGALAVLAVALLAYLKSSIKLLSFSDEIEAAVIIDRRNNRIVSVRGYEFARRTRETLDAIRAENQAIYADWEREPLCKPFKRKNETGGDDQSPSFIAITRVAMQSKPAPSSAQLLEEISLFSVLEMLSTHLSTYFNDYENSSNIKEFSRDDFPEFLMKNRIINLLSTPIEQRPIFLKAFPDPEKRPEGDIYSLWGSDGAIYSRFDLTLPVDSKLHHISRNGLKITTRRLSLSISVKSGFNISGLSRTFADKYLGTDWDYIEGKKIIVNIKGKINPFFLLINNGWNLYYWLDSFREEIKEKADFKQFKKSINWDNAIEPLLFVSRSPKPRVKKNDHNAEKDVESEGSHQNKIH